MVGRAEQGEAAGGLGQAVGLQERAADDLGGVAEHGQRDRRGPVDHVPERAPVGGLALGQGQQSLQHRGHQDGVGHLAVHQQAQHARDVGLLLEQQVAAVEVGGQQHAEPGHVEERNGRRADRTLVELDARVQFVQGAAQIAAGQLDALGHAGGTRGVQDERGLVGCRHLTGIIGWGIVPPGEIVEVGDQCVAVHAEGADIGDQGGGWRVDDDHARFGVGQDGQHLARGQPVVDRGEDRPALGRAVHDLGELGPAGADVGDAVAGAHVLALQGPGDLAGSLVEFGERGRPARLGQRNPCRGDGGPLPDDVGQRVDRRAVGVVRPGFGLDHDRLACPSATAARTLR